MAGWRISQISHSSSTPKLLCPSTCSTDSRRLSPAAQSSCSSGSRAGAGEAGRVAVIVMGANFTLAGTQYQLFSILDLSEEGVSLHSGRVENAFAVRASLLFRGCT